MDEEIQREALSAALEAIAERIEAEKGHLTDLDSAIGDADHGANMHRGFQAALEQADRDADPDAFVKGVGMALVSKVGGASGPLYGGSLAHASGELAEGITAESSVAFAEAYLEKVKDRGGASVGDKTMVDALTPAVHTYRRAIEVDGLDPLTALARATDAAERGVAFTIAIRASKGRASYLGWRSVGHPDPGATSTLYLLEEIRDVAAEYLDGDLDATAREPETEDDAGESEVDG
ncbi:dihydroxyacetone kinase subunit DhaL [Halalkalicoccus salilacus]|uniref:dihydroxyacetone kinase subunit DhaL n=1 Tax=Halalkalicoccus salilacus TaxID=3117459 RepID=UPI00300F72AD